MREYFFYCESSQTVQVVQIGCRISIRAKQGAVQGNTLQLTLLQKWGQIGLSSCQCFLLLKNACTVSSCFLFFPHNEQSGDGQEGGRSTAGSPDLILPQKYSISYDVVLGNKSSRKGEEERDIGGYGTCLPKKLLYMLMPGFLRSH